MLQNPELHYLDNAATTMVAPEVADVIDKAMREHWANPSSLYGPGARSEEALNTARPGEPSLCLFGGQEAAGAVCLHTGKTKLFLSLLLGREQDARQWLASVEHTEGLAEELTAMLREGQA